MFAMVLTLTFTDTCRLKMCFFLTHSRSLTNIFYVVLVADEDWQNGALHEGLGNTGNARGMCE